MTHIVLQVLYGAFASLIYAILFQCDKKHLLGCAIAGGAGVFVYEGVLVFNNSIYLANFLAAFSFQFVCELLARRNKTTVTTFSVCALIPLVPGAGMYYTMVYMINGYRSMAMIKCMETLGIAAALALGIIMISTIMNVYRNYKKSKA